jgi:hypothetical protein
MKLISTAAILLVAVATVTAQDAKTEAMKAQNQINGAMLKKDMKLLEKLMRASCTKNFQYIEEGQGGKPMNLDGVISTLKGAFGGFAKVTEASTKFLSFKVTGNTAVAKVKHKTSGVMAPGPDKKTHTMTMMGDAVETYVKEGKTWKMSKMVWSNSVMLMDGKPMQMPSGQ